MILDVVSPSWWGNYAGVAVVGTLAWDPPVVEHPETENTRAIRAQLQPSKIHQWRHTSQVSTASLNSSTIKEPAFITGACEGHFQLKQKQYICFVLYPMLLYWVDSFQFRIAPCERKLLFQNKHFLDRRADASGTILLPKDLALTCLLETGGELTINTSPWLGQWKLHEPS